MSREVDSVDGFRSWAKAALAHRALRPRMLAAWFMPVAVVVVLVATADAGRLFDYSRVCGGSLWAAGIFVACGYLMSLSGVLWFLGVTLNRLDRSGSGLSWSSALAADRQRNFVDGLCIAGSLVLWCYLASVPGYFCAGAR